MIGRDEQLRLLVTLMGGQLEDDGFFSMEGSMMNPIVVAYGYNSTGKSTCTRLALSTLQRSTVAFSAFVDCTTIYSRRQMFTDILRQVDPLARAQPDELTDTFQIKPAADGYHNLNFLGFLQCITKITQGRNIVIALDNVDALLSRGMSDLLRSLCRLPTELQIKMEMSFILITRGISTRMEKLLSPLFPTFIHFPLYSQSQIIDILVEQLKMWNRENEFRQWVKFLHGIFEHDCHDWVEFRQLVMQLLHLFDQHIPDEMSSTDESKQRMKQLIQQTQQHVKTHFLQHAITATTQADERVNLPFGCLLLVLASYLASFNPQESDMTFFTSSQRKRTKRHTKPKSKEGVPQQLLGPKPFPLQRLLAIYHSIHEEYEAPPSLDVGRDEDVLSRRDAFTQIGMLVRMRLLQRMTSLDVLDEVKLKCLADYEFVERIAKQLEFPIENFLNR